ncbi:MAG TPA: helix-turn-helix domain-containing protein [Steroidobacteraceae bacterium]
MSAYAYCKWKSEETAVPQTGRSGCPINLTLEQIGDRWSLIVIRDVMFGNRRSYGELLTQSEEGIASNILADRLKRLTASGLLTRRPDPEHQQKGIYSLTEAAIQLVPLLAHMGAWGRQHTSPSRELSVRAELLEKGGVPLWNAFMNELRHLHLGAPCPTRSVFGELQAAYEKALARRTKATSKSGSGRTRPSPRINR